MDIFGKALLAYYRGHSEAPIRLVRDDGWEDEHSPGLYFAPEPFQFEIPPLGLINGPTLDVGCGAGRHLRWLNGQGYKTHGLDASPGAVEVCLAQDLNSVQHFDIMSKIRPELPFTPEFITLFGNNVGIGGAFSGSAILLSNLYRICAVGGCLVLTGINVRDTDNPQHIAYQAKNVALGRRRGEIKIATSYEGETGPVFKWYHPEPNEVEELASLTGWKVEHLEKCGNFFWSALRKT